MAFPSDCFNFPGVVNGLSSDVLACERFVFVVVFCCVICYFTLTANQGLPTDCFENAGIAVVTQLLWKSIEEVVRQFH